MQQAKKATVCSINLPPARAGIMSAKGSDESLGALGCGETSRLLPTNNETSENRYDIYKSKWTRGIVATTVLASAAFIFVPSHPKLLVRSMEAMILHYTRYVPVLASSGMEEDDTSSTTSSTYRYTDDAQDDKITSVPGLDGDPGFNMFAGYLEVSKENGRNIFYWYVESQNDPSSDPVVFWTNGGPGCSGLIGFGQEHGPFHFNEDGGVRPNPYSWNKVANMLYVEQPAGVGFSYSETPTDTVDVTDDDAALDNLIAIQKFFERFPERAGNDFYISSESYGGHYVPQLAMKIVERIGNPGFGINLRGFLVGNPWVDPFTNDVAQTRAFFQHGLISLPMLEEWLSVCSDRATYDHKACPEAIRDMRKNMKSISPYALDYPVCTEEKVDLNDAASSQLMHFLNHTATNDQYPRVSVHPRFLPPDEKYLPCAEQHFSVYLNQGAVQKALHVRRTPQRWHACAPSRELSYSSSDFLDSQIDLYKELIAVAKRGLLNLSMLVFSGDNDSVCSTSSTQAWIYDLGVDPFPMQDWNEWSVDEQTAGFLTRFNLGEKSLSKFIFATIHGAGHEAAAYRPIEALELFRSFIHNEL